jgi:hypothetical protein
MSHPYAFQPRRGLIALLAVAGFACDAATLQVPGQYPTIQKAINASRTGDTILVAPGTYVGSLVIQNKGSLTLESEGGAQDTIIDGDGADIAVAVSAPFNSHDRHVRIAGFTIRNGHEYGIHVDQGHVDIEDDIVTGNGPKGNNVWGAIYVQDAAGTIRHNVVESNFDVGVYLSNPHHVLVEGNRIESSYFYGIEVNSNNDADGSATIRRNVIAGNREAGMLVIGPMDIQVADNLFAHNNHAESMVLDAFDAAVTGNIVNNTFVENAPRYPLVSFSGRVEGLQFANNIVSSSGEQAAVDCADGGGGSGVPMMHHDDAWSSAGQAVTGTCVDAFAGGEGNLSVEPGFALGQHGAKWQLQADSPLIDVGSNDAVGNVHRDIRGRPRIIDGGHGLVVDMGAYEYLPK